jgi:hypothetical protein
MMPMPPSKTLRTTSYRNSLLIVKRGAIARDVGKKHVQVKSSRRRARKVASLGTAGGDGKNFRKLRYSVVFLLAVPKRTDLQRPTSIV